MIFNKIIDHLKWRFNYFINISVPQFCYSILLKPYIYSGPFRGMKYLRASTGSVILPKLIGTYENELHFVFNEIRGNNYDQFIDVGAAEGYYVVGLGKFLFNN